MPRSVVFNVISNLRLCVSVIKTSSCHLCRACRFHHRRLDHGCSDLTFTNSGEPSGEREPYTVQSRLRFRIKFTYLSNFQINIFHQRLLFSLIANAMLIYIKKLTRYCPHCALLVLVKLKLSAFSNHCQVFCILQ